MSTDWPKCSEPPGDSCSDAGCPQHGWDEPMETGDTGTDVRDYNGNPLTEGAYVEAWRDRRRYTGTVRQIDPHHPGDGNFRHVILIRDGDQAEMRSFSDAVRVIPALLWPCGCLPNDAGAHRVGCPDPS